MENFVGGSNVLLIIGELCALSDIVFINSVFWSDNVNVVHRVEINEAFCFYVIMQPGKTLSARKWRAAFTPEGYLDLSKTLGRIQRGVSAW